MNERQNISKIVANGNLDAEKFVHAFVTYCHLLDDAVDRDRIEDQDKKLWQERVARESVGFILETTGNPFFQQHRATLVPMMVVSWNAWVDSDIVRMKDAHTADVIKGMYHEVVWMVGFITGGWKALREVTTRFRQYDFEDQPKGKA